MNLSDTEKSKPLHCKNFKPLIKEAIKKLKNGENRLAVSDYPLKDACLNGFSAPDISERLLSDYSVPSGNKDIETDYFEEIILLEKMMADTNTSINLTDWQKGTKIESAVKKYYYGLYIPTHTDYGHPDKLNISKGILAVEQDMILVSIIQNG